MTVIAFLSLLMCVSIIGLITRHVMVERGQSKSRSAVGGVLLSLILFGCATLTGWPFSNNFASGEALLPLADWVDWLFAGIFNGIGNQLSDFNSWIVHKIGFYERFLHETVTWPLMTLIFVGVAYHASRKLRLAVSVGLAFILIWSMQLWTPTMQTFSLVSLSILLTVLVGFPLGLLMSQSRRFRMVMRPVLDVMQTMPSFVYLIPGVMLFGLGNFAGIVATMIYAAPPLIRLTDLGVRQANADVLEASAAFGATRWQTLFGVQIPLALPTIMAGINQAIMMALAMVVIASMIGVRGLGQQVFAGLQRQEAGTGFVAGISIVMLAIILDRITQAYGRRLEAHTRPALRNG